jgi:hypothetical protein
MTFRPSNIPKFATNLLAISCSFALGCSAGGQETAVAKAPKPTAKEVLRLVRYSQAAQEQDFVGQIRPRRIGLKAIPLKLTMSAKEVRFVFFEGNRKAAKPDQIVILKLLDNRYELNEIAKGKSGKLAPERYAERIRGTDISFEDLAMRFLYWPNPKHVASERAKGGDAWRIRCVNPVGEGAYTTVDVWVSKESGAMVKMHGYDALGKLVKSYEVDKVNRYKGAWILEQMVVRTHPTKKGEKLTSSYLEIEPPK